MARLKYLLDTNVLSEPSRRRPDPDVESRLDAHAHEVVHGGSDLSMSCSTDWPECRTARASRSWPRYLQWVLRLEILPYDRDAARWHAVERARLTGRGRTPPFVDGQIAAIAATNGVTLVTRNTGATSTASPIWSVENWFA